MAALLATKTVRQLTRDDYDYEARLAERDRRTVQRWVADAEKQLKEADTELAAAQACDSVIGDNLEFAPDPKLPLSYCTLTGQDGSETFYWPAGWSFEITPDKYCYFGAGCSLWDVFTVDIGPRPCRPRDYTSFTRAVRRLPEPTRLRLLGKTTEAAVAEVCTTGTDRGV